MHIANGMYGLILVEPKAGMPKVDKEFYVMQSEFYTKGKFGDRGLQPFDMEKAIREQPDYVVFNGSVGAMSGDNAAKAKAGDKIRLYVGNGGPNLVSSFHVIGEIFDKVYGEGGTVVTQKNVQTTIVPAGGSAMVEFGTEIPATYILVDHSIFRAFNKGAIAQIKVEGNKNPAIYTGKTVDSIYLPEGQAIVATETPKEAPKATTLESRIEYGQQVFTQNCAACHQANGEGLPGAFPPVAKSDFLMADKARAIRVVLKGLEGEVTVNGQKYNSVMPALGLSDEQIANVLTFVRNSFGNKAGDMVTPEEVAKVRAQK
jgi:nitrite reductase (NO-forming)